MNRDEAMRDLHDIKRVMEESRTKADTRSYWIGALALVLALPFILLLLVIMPPFAPLVGIGLVVAGIIMWRRHTELGMKAISGGMIAMGGVLVVLTILMIVGLVAYSAFLEPSASHSVEQWFYTP